VDGSIAQMDNHRRLVDGSLRNLVVTADQRCRGIRCTSSIRDVDHVIEHRFGGATSFRNSQGLSKGCHVSREHPQMVVLADQRSRACTWTTPTGLTHVSLPPPAMGPGSLDRRQIHLRHWIARPPPSAVERAVVGLLLDHARHTHPHAGP